MTETAEWPQVINPVKCPPPAPVAQAVTAETTVLTRKGKTLLYHDNSAKTLRVRLLAAYRP